MAKLYDEDQSSKVTMPPDEDHYPELLDNVPEAWSTLTNHFGPRLNTYFKKREVSTQEDREDLVNETLTTFYETLQSGQYSPEKGLLAQWMYGIAHKKLNAHKKRYAQIYSNEEEFEDSHTIGNEGEATNQLSADTEEQIHELEVAMDQLSEKLREVVVLKTQVSEEWTWEEIANELGIKVSTAKMRYVRGIEKLRELLR
jgi:RNA polymerase sigma factor (sigma-70 family)